MDIDPSVIEKISREIEEKGVSVEKSTIISKMNLLVNEFGIPVDEAARTVSAELVRELNLSAGAAKKNSSTEEMGIAEAQNGDWATITGKVVSLSAPPSPAMAQTGILADDTGAVKFVVWAKANAPVLEAGKWYRFESATFDEYRGAPSMKVHSGTSVEEVSEERSLIPKVIPVREVKPGIVSIRVKVVSDYEVRHERMFQSGVVGDETSTLRYVTWKDESNTRLAEGKVYNVYYASADEYQGRVSLNFTNATIIEDEGADMKVADGSAVIEGAFVSLGPGSGVIKRCPVEGCNRVLNRQNFCPDHEIQNNFKYDLRITGVLDTGAKAVNVLIQREEVERVTGITLEKAVEIVESGSLGFDDVLEKFKEILIGRYFTCRGSDLDGTLLVKNCQPAVYDSGAHAALINRAGNTDAEEGM